MKNVLVYIVEPVYGCHEGEYAFGGEPMGICEVDYLNTYEF